MKIEKSALILQKKYPDLEKKCPVCEHLWIKFSFKIQFVEYLRKKTTLISLLFLYAVLEAFIEVPLFQETSPAPQNSWSQACYDPRHDQAKVKSLATKSCKIFKVFHHFVDPRPCRVNDFQTLF